MDDAAKRPEAQTVVVVVRTLAGNVVAVLSAAPEEIVGALKQRVLQEMAARGSIWRWPENWHAQLIHDRAAVPDCCRLRACIGACAPSGQQPTLEFSLLLTPSSSLARRTEAFGCSGSRPCGVGDVADAVFQSEHAASVCNSPRAEDILRALPLEVRHRVLSRLVMLCEVGRIDEAFLHGATLTLDRYAATCPGLTDDLELLKLSLAALYIEIKFGSAEDDHMIWGQWHDVLVALGEGQQFMAGVLDSEVKMLRQIKFAVGVPTVLTFLNGLGMRFVSTENPPVGYTFRASYPLVTTRSAVLQLSVAYLIAELVLFNVELEYRYPPAILAASTLGAALCAVGPSEEVAAGGEAVPLRDMHGVLIEDLRSYCPNVVDVQGKVRACELDVLRYWQECAAGISSASFCYGYMCWRHYARTNEARTSMQETRPAVALHRYHLLHDRDGTLHAEGA